MVTCGVWSRRAKLSACGNHGDAAASPGLGGDPPDVEGLQERGGLLVLKAKVRLSGRAGNVFTVLRREPAAQVGGGLLSFHTHVGYR